MLSNKEHEIIAEAAYYKWLEAGKPDGRDRDFWFQAESEFTSADVEIVEVVEDYQYSGPQGLPVTPDVDPNWQRN
jgi:hypothetical protein